MNETLRQLLVTLADRYETASFIEGDPSWFMHQVNDPLDQETTAFLAMCLSYGSRQQFLPKIEKLMEMAHWHPYDWIAGGTFGHTIAPSPQCFYRLYTFADIHALCATLHDLFQSYGTLGHFAQTAIESANTKSEDMTDAEAVLSAFATYFRQRGIKGLVPMPYTSACKRPCMFLRWMVRDGSPVDLGLWSDFIDKRHLFIPLDTHVMQTANKLRLDIGKTAGWRAVVVLTQLMREAFPDDPARADYALYGYDIGLSTENLESRLAR